MHKPLPDQLAIPSNCVSKICRIFYALGGAVEQGDGELELYFGDEVMRFSGAADGETLRAARDVWHDPFAAPLSANNETYVRDNGKWTRVDVSDLDPYATFIGKVIHGARWIRNDAGTITGVVLDTENSSLRFQVDCDECHVGYEKL